MLIIKKGKKIDKKSIGIAIHLIKQLYLNKVI